MLKSCVAQNPSLKKDFTFRDKTSFVAPWKVTVPSSTTYRKLSCKFPAVGVPRAIYSDKNFDDDEAANYFNPERVIDDSYYTEKYKALKERKWNKPSWSELSPTDQARLDGLPYYSMKWHHLQPVLIGIVIFWIFKDTLAKDMARWPEYITQNGGVALEYFKKGLNHTIWFTNQMSYGKLIPILEKIPGPTKVFLTATELFLNAIPLKSMILSGAVLSFCAAVAEESIPDKQKLKLRFIGFPLGIATVASALVFDQEKKVIACIFTLAVGVLNSFLRLGGPLTAVTPSFLMASVLFGNSFYGLFIALVFTVLARSIVGLQKGEKPVAVRPVPLPLWILRPIFFFWGIAAARVLGKNLIFKWMMI